MTILSWFLLLIIALLVYSLFVSVESFVKSLFDRYEDED